MASGHESGHMMEGPICLLLSGYFPCAIEVTSHDVEEYLNYCYHMASRYMSRMDLVRWPISLVQGIVEYVQRRMIPCCRLLLLDSIV